MPIEVYGAPASSGSGAPTDAQYVVMASDSTLSAERVLTAGDHVSVTNGGSAATLDWRYNAAKRSIIDSDCNAVGNMLSLASGTGASVSFATAATSDANHPGVCRATTGTTTTGRSGLGSGSTDQVVLGSGEVRFCAIVKVTTLSNATENFVVHAGLIDTLTGTSVDGVYFEYNHGTNAGDWTAMVRSNSVTQLSQDLNSAVATGTWYKLEIVTNAAGTSTDFKIDGTTVHTFAGTHPTGTARATGFAVLIRKTAGTTARTMDIDYTGISQEVAR